MGETGAWYVIIGTAVLGAWAALLVAALVDAVWAGRRRYPKVKR